MKSGTRGLIISVLLFLLWGTFLSSPFRYFVYALTDLFRWAFSFTNFPSAICGIGISILCAVVTIILLVLSAKKNAYQLAGVCALLSLAYYLFICIRSRSLDTLAFSVTLGMALALLFLVFKANKASLILADIYIFSVPVLLFSELVFVPILGLLQIQASFLSGYSRSDSITILGDYFGAFIGIPSFVWSSFLFVIILIPFIFFSKDRKTT